MASKPSAAHIPVTAPGELVAGVGASESIDPLILTIDVGTSSVRAMLFDARARAIEGLEAQHIHQMHTTADGGVETDAERLLDRTETCIDALLALAGPLAERIGAVAPTTFWHNVLGVSTAGKPLTPLYTWADTRSSKAAEELRAALDPGAVHARTGCVLHPSYLPAKLRWLQSDARHGPANGKAGPRGKVRHWLSFAEFMLLRFFGSPSCSISMASGSGLLDQHRCGWDEEVLAAIPVDPQLLSPLSDDPRHGLAPSYARRWPTLATVPWYPGWGDGATSNVGSGCLTRHQIAMMVGTSAAMRAVWSTSRITIPPKLWCYRVDARRVVIGGALSNGGNLLQWLRETLTLPADSAAIEAGIAGMEPDAHGLTILPFLAGERSTGWVPRARATISGMSLSTQPMEILRAGYEAIAYRCDLIHDLLHEIVPEARNVVASGGALLHSPTWLQMMADVLGTTITASAVREASSRGAALLAGEALGVLTQLETLPAPTGQIYHPDHTRSRIYGAAAARQRALYELLIAPIAP